MASKTTNPKARVLTAKRSSPFALNDGRSAFAQRFRALCSARCADLGGVDILSAQQLSLVRRSVILELSLETMENEAAAGQSLDAAAYAQASGTLLRILRALGLKKQVVLKQQPSLANWRSAE